MRDRRITFIYCSEDNNVGDRYSSPHLWLDFQREKRVMAFSDRELLTADRRLEEIMGKDDVILGGGGLLWQPQRIMNMLSTARGKKILWGVGHNDHRNLCSVPYDSQMMSQFNLVGVRDYGTDYRWVPCASCLSPSFNKKPPPPKHEVVVYSHWYEPIGIDWGYPRMRNGKENTLDRILDFLSSGKIILTNTYHGVFWSMLLEKPIICFPFSSRFFSLPKNVQMCQDGNWRSLIKSAIACSVSYRGLLDRCRKTNNEFFKHVMRVLNED